MTMKKRITSFALVLLMVLSSLAMLLPATGVKAAAAGESTYTKVTEAPTDWSGTYIIVYENGAEGYAFNGVDAANGYTTVTIADGKATAEDATKTLVEFVIAKMANDGEYSIRIYGGTNNGKYIYHSTKKNVVSYSDTAAANTITMDKDGVNIVSDSYTLRFNSDKEQTRFRYYGSGQQAIQLYKLDNSSTPTEPDVPVHEGDHTYGEWTYNDTTHSRKCTIKGCNATETANHEITSWTYLDANKHTGKCKDCGYTTEAAHNWETDTEATSVPDGKLAQKCSVCGEKRTVDKPNTVTETIDFTKCGFINDKAVPNGKHGNFALTFDKGSNSNAPKYYTKGTAVRMYGGNKLTIKGVNGEKIAKIEFTFASGEGSNEIEVNSGAFITNTWTGSANEVTFTIKGSSGHRRIKSLAITYEAPATEPEAPEFKYATLDIKENIDVNFYVSVPNGYDVANLKTFFNFHRADTSVVGEPVNTENGLLYRFTLKDVAPHLMGENITATLKNSDTVIATLAYSINTYLDNQKKDTTLSDSTKALIESIAAYGDKAADYNNKISDSTTFTGTATADPADMTESKPTIGTTLEGFRFKGVAVRMENNIRIRVSFENTSGTELKFFVKVGDGKETEAILSNGYVYTDLIAPSAYDTEYTIIAKNAGGETVGTVSLSVNTYVCMVLKAFPADGTLTNAQAAMRELAIAIYNYGKAAKTAIGA